MGWYYPNACLNITSYVSTIGSWATSSTISELDSTAKAVWLRIRQSSATSVVVGATLTNCTMTNLTSTAHVNYPVYLYVPIDSNRRIRYYASLSPGSYGQNWEVLAWTDNDEAIRAATLPTYTPSVADSYQSRTFSEIGGEANFAIIIPRFGTVYRKCGYRDSGASYDYYHQYSANRIITTFCPVTSKVGEIKVSDTAADQYLAGWVGAGASKTTPAQITIPGTGWQTIDASSYFPAGASMALILAANFSTVKPRTCAFRNTGSTENITTGVNIAYHSSGDGFAQFHMVGLNSNRQFDVNVDNTTDVKIFSWGSISNSLNLALDNFWNFNIGLLEQSFQFYSARKTYLEVEL